LLLLLLLLLQVPADLQLPAQVRIWWADVALLRQQDPGVLRDHGGLHRVRLQRVQQQCSAKGAAQQRLEETRL
jgi:hypothetical protein